MDSQGVVLISQSRSVGGGGGGGGILNGALHVDSVEGDSLGEPVGVEIALLGSMVRSTASEMARQSSIFQPC